MNKQRLPGWWVLLWAMCVLASLGVGLGALAGAMQSPAGVQESARPLSTLERHIATRCRVLFENDRPFTYYLWREEHWPKMYEPQTLVDLRRGRIGTVVIWGWHKNHTAGGAPLPDANGRFEARDPAALRSLINFLHAVGIKVATHVHPGAYRDAGFSGVDLVAELERQRGFWGFDTVHADGADLGNSMDEALHVITSLRATGWRVHLHDTITPFQAWSDGTAWRTLNPSQQAEAGRVYWVSPVARKADESIWGETMPGPPSVREVRDYLRQRSGVLVRPATMCTYYPSVESCLRGHPELYYDLLPGLLMGHYMSSSERPAAYLQLFIPAYEAERAEYLDDPPGYVRRKASRAYARLRARQW